MCSSSARPSASTARRRAADIVRWLLRSDPQIVAIRDYCILNAASALWVAGVAGDWKEAAAKCAEVIDSGKVTETIDKYVALSKA